MGVWPKVRPEKRMPSMASTTYTGTRGGTQLGAEKIAAMLNMGDSDCCGSSKMAYPCACTGQGWVGSGGVGSGRVGRRKGGAFSLLATQRGCVFSLCHAAGSTGS